jgi:hemoglobin
VLDEGSTPIEDSVSVYAAAGGLPFFVALVDRFYAGVAADPVLLAIYPEPADLAGARHRLSLFLAQYWGGPRTYDAERGHPRLRMRHAPFAIGPAERDAWLRHMNAAIAALEPPPAVAAHLKAYFENVAEGLRNRP